MRGARAGERGERGLAADVDLDQRKARARACLRRERRQMIAARALAVRAALLAEKDHQRDAGILCRARLSAEIGGARDRLRRGRKGESTC